MSPEQPEYEHVICPRCGAIVAPAEMDEDSTECVHCRDDPYFDE